ncbi:NYN domain-containing protein [Pseudoalteromonas peptidolytica]|uniref:NYN domain-containing protein n=1 Tax=Pseudoalteromonas peptidolytica TaxID=61150 RepID=UPI00298DFA96|nr:NYN domain-containing protein [Pseudoalteromonas peptidolytica]MDW7547477.1 NYN domain-containing protein [Pseudoalteromonas peptidolytica]
MKTRIYIDGYNLYYGCLKRTPYKWLDLYRLFHSYILPSSSHSRHSYSDLSIKYFTADIVANAAKSEDSLKDQQAYHRALTFNAQEGQLEIIKGYYATNQTRAFKIDESNPKKPPKECEYVDVWKLEEKQTDVNIAVESLYDVMTDDSLEQVIFVTNDTDLSRVLEKIQSLNKVKVGLVIPTTDNVRMPNEKLDKFSDWTRKNILIEELKASQLPRVVEGKRKPVVKPVGWYGEPDVIENIFEVLLTVLKNRTKCWKWLETTPPSFEDLPRLPDLPINMLDDATSANTVLLYAKKYVSISK